MARMGSTLSFSLSHSRRPCGGALRATAESFHTHIKSFTAVIPSSNPHALVSRTSFSSSSILVPSRSQGRRLGFRVLRIQVPSSTRFILRSVLCWEAGVAGTIRGGANMVEVVESVKLTREEDRIFATLIATLKHFDLDTQLRVAGGWVRDKLLGKDSHDIDIALDNMLGKQFCEKVNDYLKSIGEETSGVGVIQSNPEQSKHLETARMRVKGVWVDFVNLRAETYAQNSRIPTMEFGTAEQDALRRDLTINSLFYNVNTRSVEDLTGQGIRDLKAGIIRTPLPPKETFLDDPLRVLRAVRFGARFGFELEEELKVAVSCEEVKEALENKVSRERIGHEIDLMLMGQKPVEAMRCLEQLQLFPVIFTAKLLKINPPLVGDYGRLCVDYMQAAGDVLGYFEGIPSAPEVTMKLTDKDRRMCFLSSLLLSLRHVTSSHAEKRGMKDAPISEVIIKECLKLKSEDANQVNQLHSACERFLEVTDIHLMGRSAGQENGSETVAGRLDPTLVEDAKKRVQAGLLLGEIKGLWRIALVLSSLLSPPLDQRSPTKRAQQCIAAEDAILKLGLENVWTRKPLLNGNKVMSLLELKKGGPQVREWMARLKKWELAHPDATEEQCVEWFKVEHVKRLRVRFRAERLAQKSTSQYNFLQEAGGIEDCTVLQQPIQLFQTFGVRAGKHAQKSKSQHN